MKKELSPEQFNKSGDEEKKKKSVRRREVAEWAMVTDDTKKKSAIRREEAEKAMVTAGTIRRYAEEMGVSITKEFLGETVLDLGSGYSDDFQREAAKKGIKVYSLSEALSREGIRNRIKAVLKRKYKGKKTLEDIPSVAGLAQELPFKSNVFDSVVSSYAIPMYLELEKEEYELAFREIVRVLKAGRKAYLCPKTESGLDLKILKELKKDFKKEKFADIDLEVGDAIVVTKPKESGK